MTWLNLALILAVTLSYVSSYGDSTDNYLSPDKIMLGNIGREIWQRRGDVVFEASEEFGLMEEEVIEALFEVEEDGGDIDNYLDCPVCVAFVRGLQALITQGLTFEDIRDFAVDVCKNVTVDLNYDGEIMCDGIIDVFGPHVYYVLNETNMTARGVCEFHKQCPESVSTKTSPQSYPIRTKEVNLKKPEHPRRQSQKQIIKLAHITDVHLDEKYAAGSPDTCQLPICCRDYWPGSGSAGPWGSYECALPLNTLDHIMSFISDLGVDMVINTGDTPNHALWEETQAGQLWQSEMLTNAIRNNLPGVPAHLCVGNHDTYPTNLFYGPSPLIKDLLHDLRVMYQDLANFTEDQIATFENAGYYVTEILPGLKILSYNSNYGYTDNFYGVLLQDSPDWSDSVSFMEEQFDIARANGDKIILLGHHSMGGGFNFWHDFINDIMMRNGDLVIMHLMGHSHSDFYKMALDAEGNAVHVNQATGSLMSTRNPTFKIFHLDTETLTPTHFDNYFINISKAVDAETPPEIELMYSSNTDYGMPDLSAASYQDFTDRMEQDDDLLRLFQWNENSRYSDPGPCDEGCKKRYLCSRRTTSSDRYNECINS